jgi:hypothetical protein
LGVSVTRKNVKIIIKINFEKIVVVINRGMEDSGKEKSALSPFLPRSLARSLWSRVLFILQQLASAIESIR